MAGNAYAPFGAILTSTEDHDNVGDLIFAINFTGTPPTTEDYLYHSLTIYLPPEFIPPVDWAAPTGDTSNIVTTITNNYLQISVWKAGVKDPFGPGWWVIYINPWLGFRRDGSASSGINVPANYGRNPRGILFSKSNNYDEWYYVRVNAHESAKDSRTIPIQDVPQ